MLVKVNVREIVETVYGSGDLISETLLIKRAEIGALIHREHQMCIRDRGEDQNSQDKPLNLRF